MPASKVKERVADQETSPPALYDRDFYAWTMEQAAALRDGRLSALDRENLAEEIEDLGKAVFKDVRSAFRVILVHMLKWDHQPERRSRSWANSIRTQRIELHDVLDDNPSLRGRRAEAVLKAYRTARLDAATEMGRSERTLPESCPYALDDILTREFPWPQD